MSIKYIDAKRLRRILIGGALWVKKHENYLNELNVYPVPDGDTGSNMSMTLETMKKEIEKNTTKKSSMQEVIEVVEDAVLLGARGNSGTILSQILTGFLRGIENKKRLEKKDIAIALEHSKNLAYTSVDTPVEGTILTVIREVSEKANNIVDDINSLDKMLEILTETAKESVDKTPLLLPKLKEAKVVDSGAMGLYYFFIGISKALTEIEEITNTEIQEKDFSNKMNDITHDPAEIHFKYCTEFIIRNSNFDIDTFKQDILKLGDSAVFAQTSKKFKIHVHTNNPGKALELAVLHGDLEKIKIENMKLQNEGLVSSEKDQAKIFVNNKSNLSKYSYVILSDTNSLKNEFLTLGADVVILGGQSQNPSVQDILNSIAKVKDNKQILILPNNKNVISTANIAADKTEKNVLVIPTKTMLEGYFFLKNHLESLESLINENTNNVSIEITKAVRETSIDGLKIELGDYIALINTKIKHANKNLSSLISELKYIYFNNNYINFVTIAKSNKLENDNIDLLTNGFKNKIIETEQDNYLYYIYVENKPNNMPKIAIVTDSSCDLSNDIINSLPIYVTPIRLDSNGVNYKDGINLSKEEFWNKLLNKKEIFKTAQPSPKELTNLYSYLFDKGYDKILCLNISSVLSGTFNVSKLVIKNMNKEKDIIQIDTKAVSIPLGVLVQGAAIKSKNGDSLEDIINWCNKIKEKSKTFIVVSSLEYLERGGRISKTAKSIGDFLNLKPVLTINQGLITSEKKVLGEKAALSYIEKYINEIIKKHSINIYTAYSPTPKEKEAVSYIVEKFKNNPKVKISAKPSNIGPTVGSHAGPVFGICIVPKLL